MASFANAEVVTDTSCCLQGLDLLSKYQHIAIFDADFKPEPDFLVSRPFCCAACVWLQQVSLAPAQALHC